MPGPHEKSVESALETVEELGELFDRLRAANSPMHRAYRTVLRALRGNLSDRQAVREALDTLKNSVKTISGNYFEDAQDIGYEQAERDLKIYSLGEPQEPGPNDVKLATTSVLGVVDEQAQQAISVARLELGEELVLGDDTRRGILQPSPVMGQIAFWITGLSVLSYATGVGRKMPDAKRQAVAQIDDATTQTCLNVHGQVVGLRENFHLTGTPKYASDMRNPPFHQNCRTVVITIPASAIDKQVTKEMRDDAIEQGKKPKPSTRATKAHYRVVGKSVQQFRDGRWHTYKRYKTNIAARSAAAKLNEERRS